MRVIVIGCGIGGMATAIGLRRAGIEHVVLEQAPALLPVGAGIQLSPNAVRVLEWLGIGERMAEFCVEPGAHLFRDWQGEPLLTTPLMPKVRETFGAPYYHAHRADLLDAMVEQLGTDGVRLDAKVTRVAQDQNGVAVTLADGSVERGDVLIGADGIHSLVRETLFRPEPPRFSGNIAWRGLVPAEIAGRLGFERNSYIWMGPGRCMVLYYVSGGRLLNWIGLGETDGTTVESWSARGRTEDALAQFAGWHPQITGLIEATPAPYKFAIYDREPLSAWVDGRIALLGDAAHAMLPYHAQGAAQSIEDAWVLARCLEEGRADPAAALKQYESLRLDRANRVVEQSRAAADSYQLTEPAAVAKRNARLAKHQAVAGEFPPGQRWLFAYDAEQAVRGDDAGWRQTSW